MKTFAFLLLLAGIALPASAAEVYRCVTGNGVVRYSDKPCNDGKVEKLDIESRPTNEEAVKEQTEQRKTEVAELDSAEADAEKAAAEAAKAAEERKAQCAAARSRLQKLMVARRVTEGEGENRKFLESAEILERRQAAQDKVNELCGGQEAPLE